MNELSTPIDKADTKMAAKIADIVATKIIDVLTAKESVPRHQKGNPPCPHCGGATACKEVPIASKKGGWRRRRTYTCKVHPSDPSHQFMTDEKYTLGGPMLLQKSDGRETAYEFDALVEGLSRAATPGELPSLVFQIARKVTTEVWQSANKKWAGEKRSSQTRPTLPRTTSAEVGQTVLNVLKGEKRFAMWIRFAIIHKKLDKDAHALVEVLDNLYEEWGAGPAWKKRPENEARH